MGGKIIKTVMLLFSLMDCVSLLCAFVIVRWLWSCFMLSMMLVCLFVHVRVLWHHIVVFCGCLCDGFW